MNHTQSNITSVQWSWNFGLALALLWCFSFSAGTAVAQSEVAVPVQPSKPPAKPTPKKEKAASGPVPLNPKKTVLIDKPGGRLVLKGTICLREGVLEMFLCKKQTKEHESIVTLDADAATIHAGLLALGAKSGTPVSYRPEYQPPTGTKIKITMEWLDEKGKKKTAKAHEWVRNATFRYFEESLAAVPEGVELSREENSLRYDEMNQLLLWYGHMTKSRRDELLKMSKDAAYQKVIRTMFADSQFKELEADFIFAGSGFSKLEDGTQIYQAENGSVICVANFGDAMIDINVNSPPNSGGLLFEPWTERIPKPGTAVDVILSPVLKPEVKKSDDETKE